MMKRENSSPALKDIYSWLRKNVFPEGYLVPADKVIFEWTDSKKVNGFCSKSDKYILISRRLCSDPFRLYDVMINEMLHLRLNHHRKSFYNKQRELKKVLEQRSVKLIN